LEIDPETLPTEKAVYLETKQKAVRIGVDNLDHFVYAILGDFHHCGGKIFVEIQIGGRIYEKPSDIDMPYSEKCKDPRWQRKRLEVFQRDNWTCCECAETRKTLHIHHLNYQNGKNPWEYEITALQTLCSSCHARRHNKKS
jgi:hypothetical protein